MRIEKKGKNKSTSITEESKVDSLWRKPITLDVVENEDDPLATLYKGREVSESPSVFNAPPKKIKNAAAKSVKESKSAENSQVTKKLLEGSGKKTTETATSGYDIQANQTSAAATTGKIAESELKDILKIKSETFHFTDIREILRGKSIDIYAYLRLLCGDEEVCKIKHLDMMKQLNISRPTLFKQGEWLTRLLLIEKRNVPGDHLGTSYTVHRLEDVLPISDILVKQLESHIETLRLDHQLTKF